MLAAIIEADWEHQLEHSPTYASVLGDRRWNDRWDDLSLAALEAEHRHDLDLLAALDRVAAKGLTAEEKLDSRPPPAGGRLARRGRTSSDGTSCRSTTWAGLPEGIKQPPGIQTAAQLAGNLRFEAVKDYEDWLARLQRFPAYVEQHIALMREGMKRKLVHPRVILSRIPGQLDGLLVKAPEESAFYAPFTSFPASVPEADVRAYAPPAPTRSGRRCCRPCARSAPSSWASTCRRRPRPSARGSGREVMRLYAYWARRYTTTAMTVDEIHALGLAEVARLRGEMETVMKSTGWKGTLAEFFQHLRADPKSTTARPRTSSSTTARWRSVSTRR
jgi:uncharacterized protein (DUF885 family)